VLRQIKFVRHLTDTTKCLRRLAIQSGLRIDAELNAILERL